MAGNSARFVSFLPSIMITEDRYKNLPRGENHHMRHMKENYPEKYALMVARMSESRKKLVASERRRINYGMSQRTKIALPQYSYSRTEVQRRSNARLRGYIVGNPEELQGERYNIYWTKETSRCALFERNCEKAGFRILQYHAPTKNLCARV